MATYNPLVFDRKSVFMQRIADHARAGYLNWTSGEVPVQKAALLARKFADLYLVGLTIDTPSSVRSWVWLMLFCCFGKGKVKPNPMFISC